MDIHVDASKLSQEDIAKIIRDNPDADFRIDVTNHAISSLRELADELESGKKKIVSAEIISTPEQRPYFTYRVVVE